jgi:hypothetical protein
LTQNVVRRSRKRKHSKNRLRTCYFFISSADRKTEIMNRIYVLFRMKPEKSGFSRVITRETSFANGCLRQSIEIIQ